MFLPLESQTSIKKGYVALCQSRGSLLSSKTDIVMISGQARLFHEMADLVYFPPLSIKEDPLKKSTPNPSEVIRHNLSPSLRTMFQSRRDPYLPNYSQGMKFESYPYHEARRLCTG